MATPSPHPFFDANVIFSGIYNADGPPGTLLRLHAEGEITAVVSRQVLQEVITAFHNKRPDLLGALYVYLTNAPPEVCPDPTLEEVHLARQCINENDAPILAAAIKGTADCIVSGNTRHFNQVVAECAKAMIFTPAEYLDRLAAGKGT